MFCSQREIPDRRAELNPDHPAIELFQRRLHQHPTTDILTVYACNFTGVAMGKTEPPFLYDPPSLYPKSAQVADFNPKAVTLNSWAPRPQRPKKNGPLVNFNQHPDSYAVIPTGTQPVTNMSPNIKKYVKYARLCQLLLRVLTLIGVLGILFCVICINNTTIQVAWIIRVGPAVAVVHAIYAIFHLCRSAMSRTPGSTASYMLFAAVLDAGLIPFFVFTALISRTEHESKSYGWNTLFGEDQVTEKIIYATVLTATTLAGLHIASLVIDIYLAVVFRKINKLPPDMNPLEENLTSRRHKRTKSEIAEKHLSQSTIGSSETDPYSTLLPATRTVPFAHTRNNSSVTITANQFQKNGDDRLSYYSAKSHRHSRCDLPSQQMRQYEETSRPKTPIGRTTVRGRGNGSSRPQSVVFQTPPSTAQSQPQTAAIQNREPSGVSSMGDDNWEAYPSNPPSPELHAREVSPLRDPIGSPGMDDHEARQAIWDDDYEDSGLNQRSGTVRRHRGVYAAVDDEDDEDDDEAMLDPNEPANMYGYQQSQGERYYAKGNADNLNNNASLGVNPLGMNPPTPRPLEVEGGAQHESSGDMHRTALSDLPNPSTTTTPVKGTPGSKTRSYGELAQSTPSPGSNKKSGSRWRRKSGRLSAYESLRADNADSDGNMEARIGRGETDRKGRVVSNTGIDLGPDLGSGSPGYGNYLAGLGVGRRREVSGKLAEEGRGADLVQDESESSPSKNRGHGPSKSKEIKAAGWARWKGL
ncbi:uncharacterized protein GIQ15_05850 [Arthroderma uncinatum]|uniref:uncharacterized protein n=1 Tax=Arthroderma uncinatum TaxID=74035 RepID=UPI00144ABCC1|nr:uncharacterized protein GIQ15_05850 [Arthroderma uncinatum]KAF3480503.1 hypothetical protein GIQ15_05850 [Arthroderma uncinatum]